MLIAACTILLKVEIDIKIAGKTSSAKPLTENNAAYKIAKESAKQLGLEFEEES